MIKLERDKDTICALATPPGHGGIGVVRVSGSNSLNVVRKSAGFLPKNPESHRCYFGTLKQNSRDVDEVLATYFAEGKSYTGDQTIEISCHGGPVIYDQILKALVEGGARPAERGEFTYRAFMNGNLDLVQAESVLSLIESKSKKAAELAMRQLKGGLSSQLDELCDELTWVMAHLEANIDYAHEDLEVAGQDEICKRLSFVESKLGDLLKSYKKGRSINDGFKITLVGAPNVGKSSLLNALIGEDRSIVTDRPGTTRDFIETNLVINGFKVDLFDTAGLRETDDQVEKIGVEKTKALLIESDLKVQVLDLSRSLTEDETESLKSLSSENSLIIGNKKDAATWSLKDLGLEKSFLQIEVSALEGDGIEKLKSLFAEKIGLDESEDSAVISQARHFELLSKAGDAVTKTLEQIELDSSPEFVIAELQESLFSIFEVLGRRFDDEVMDRVFKEFCLGK